MGILKKYRDMKERQQKAAKPWLIAAGIMFVSCFFSPPILMALLILGSIVCFFIAIIAGLLA